jgi:hypothetical protein
MKFRARVSVASALERVLHALEKVSGSSEDAVLVMSPESWSFRIAPASGATAGILSFCEIATNGVFDKYRIASSIEGNKICLLLEIGNLLRALRSALGLVKVLVALVKRDDAVSLEFSVSGEAISLVQNVPVKIGNARNIEESSEPQVPEPAVKFYMPELKTLKIIVDRLKSVRFTILEYTSNSETFSYLILSKLMSLIQESFRFRLELILLMQKHYSMVFRLTNLQMTPL